MPRPIAIDDFMRLRLVSDAQVTPDGTRVACVVKRIERDKNKYVSQIWVVPTDVEQEGSAGNGEARPFTGDDSSASHPRWSPDGKLLAFLSDRQKPLNQIYIMPGDGGEARTLTHLDTEGSIGGFRWSPDGGKIAFTFRATPQAYRKDVVEERKKKELSSPVRHHDRLFYRLDGMGYWDGEYSQVWVADAKTGEAKQLTAGAYNCDVPTWSPDSQTLAFLSDRREDGDIAPAQNDIWTLAVGDVFAAGAGAASAEANAKQAETEHALTRIASPPGSKSSLAWSPDGKAFAYVGLADPLDTWHSSNERVFLLPATGSDTARDLTGHTDKSVGWLNTADSHDVGAGDMLQWEKDSSNCYFPVSAHGDTQLYMASDTENPLWINLKSVGNLAPMRLEDLGEPACIFPESVEMGGFHLCQNQREFPVTMATAIQPHEVYLYTSNGLRPLTRFNADFLTEVQVAAPEPIDVDNGSGGKVPGWLLKPVDMQPGEKYPLVVYVHGGPHLQYGNTFHHELQWLAAQGYVVLYTNPRGSKGYGEAHTKAIAGNWGSVDYDDVMAATHWACSLEFVDAQRTAIMGGSYGGYMTAWAIGHTNRFRCAIADRLVANLHSMSGTCDFPWRPDHPFKGDGWNDPAQLWKCSPLAYAGNITTPLLLIHYDGDLRCPAEQADQLFSALRHQRKVVEYVRYPSEASHGLSRSGPPDLRLDRLQRNLDWLNRWLKA